MLPKASAHKKDMLWECSGRPASSMFFVYLFINFTRRKVQKRDRNAPTFLAFAGYSFAVFILSVDVPD